MANKMLIDAAHPEETRVVVVRGKRVEEFDYESANKKQLRGNIYLAKVTRVEPSLQAAFVDYGGNRHGFLAFNEIHPDYYQIPVADRNLLKEEEAREAAEQREQENKREEEAERRRTRRGARKRKPRRKSPAGNDVVEYISERDGADYLAARQVSEVIPEDETRAETPPSGNEKMPDETGDEQTADETATDLADTSQKDGSDQPVLDETTAEADPSDEDAETPEVIGSEDALEEVPVRPKRRRRKTYRIQEVIRRNQIILIQVVKEERGNKGAALTTYLSLAGRYTVLMPNTARGGGISRKITNIKDRKRLREIANSIPVPEGTGLIVRTAGATRTKAEIRRDFDYLLRLWENIREYTLSSSAPTLIYEEGNLIKRSIRDLYSREIDEVLVAGDEAYREAKDFMRLIMPSHAKNVHHYKDQEPLFMRYQIERQLNDMFNPQVKLKSGGYIVINQTEALVAVDVNSGKSTKEFSIEETALNTNLEAAKEVARQLRLRDLAGLIVIDFIDMDERKNNLAVEQMMKNSLKSDRARIQVGHISAFGLLEMSRQRLRTGVLEGSTTECAHCMGTGIIRSTESVALYVLRAVEDALISGQKQNLKVNTTTDAALYILNYKRAYLKEIEHHYGVTVTIVGNSNLHGVNFTIEKGAPGLPLSNGTDAKVVSIDWAYQDNEDQTDGQSDETDRKDETPRKRSRRPRRRKPRTENKSNESPVAEASGEQENPDDDSKADKPRRPRRRGRRGGRNRNTSSRDSNRETAEASTSEQTDETAITSDKTEPSEKKEKVSPDQSDQKKNDKPADKKQSRSSDTGKNGQRTTETTEKTPETESRRSRDDHQSEAEPAQTKASQTEAPPRKRGWWQRKTS